ncbi:hypothetical protein AWW66_21375 [Micromonospora rosaria]|uniref:Uncharacterized protein n=2 Tax=Micromonospora rosaria TaxID=47874 RepID=A0A136PNH4_9ACTN|nr:hypothetical protein AWW66_21375 [Micromonospora rosaria]
MGVAWRTSFVEPPTMTNPQALVGRTDELRHLVGCLPHPDRPAGRAAFVLGDAGTGKSRLVTELGRRARANGLTVLTGRSSPTAGPAPCRPYCEAFSALSRAAGMPTDPELEPLRPVLGGLVPEWARYAELGPAASPLVLAEAVLRLLRVVGRRHGCLLVLEDLQHADEVTLTVTEYLVDNLTDQPAALVGTARAGAGPAVDLAETAGLRRTARLLHLDRLDAAEVDLLAAHWLGVRPDRVPAGVLDRLHADGDGNPFVVEELLGALLSAGVLVRRGEGWEVSAEPARLLPPTVVRSLDQRLRPLPPPVHRTLRAAALLGADFPVDVLRAALAVDEPTVWDLLGQATDHRFVRADDETPGRYRFRAALAPAALLAPLTVAERRDLAGRLADAVQARLPDPATPWLPYLATLRHAAGDRAGAARLHAEAGRAALARGSAQHGVDQLSRAWELTGDEPPAVRADLLDALLVALIETGDPHRALGLGTALDGLAETVPPARLALLQAHLARAAGLTGRTRDGLSRVRLARRTLRPAGDGSPADPAPALAALDLVEARLLHQLPEPASAERIAELADRAGRTARDRHRPDQLCAALEVQALLAARTDADRSRSALQAMLHEAERHDLPCWRLRSLVHLATEYAWREGSPERLRAVRAEAARTGHRTLTADLDGTAAMVAALHGEYDRADTLADRARRTAERAGHPGAARYAALAAAVAAGHRGRRREMAGHLARFHDDGAAPPWHLATATGLAEACCALLEEDRPRAVDLLDAARAAGPPHAYDLSGGYGLWVLLGTLDGWLDRAGYRAVATAPQAGLRWNRQFVAAAEAVRAGREGRPERAVAAFRRALEAAGSFPTARHLLLRLVGEAALADGWGPAAEWVRTAEEHFLGHGLTAPAAACRGLLRRAGLPVAQRRRGCERIPHPLRVAGVTAREFEVLVLLAGRLRNAEIGRRLFISDRTVEKHVTNLLVKVGKSTRLELADFATATGLVSAAAEG